MDGLTAMTTTGATVDITAAVEALRSSVRGDLLRPSDDGYDQARTLWNARHDRRPALVVRCAGASDVIAAVNFARTHRVPVAVRGGGHNVAGSGACDGGLLLDMSGMKRVEVDPAGATARAEPGL